MASQRKKAVGTWATGGGLTGGLFALFQYVDVSLDGQFWLLWRDAVTHAWPAFKSFLLGSGVMGGVTAWARDRPAQWAEPAARLTYDLDE